MLKSIALMITCAAVWVGAQAPSSPRLSYPAGGAKNIPDTATLIWRSSAGATSYRLQVSTDSTYATTVFDDSTLTDTTKAMSGLADSTLYYWHVLAKNASGSSAFSRNRSFTTLPLITAIPTTPTLVSPADSAKTNQTPTLRWNIASGATNYRLQVSKDTSFSAFVYNDSTLTDTSRGMTALTDSTPYYWRVQAKNAMGLSAFSATRTFTTMPPAPASPTMVYPANAAKNIPDTVTIKWRVTSGATTYRLQVALDSAFNTLAFDDSTLTDTAKAMAGLVDSTLYYWHVRAKGPGGTSAYARFRTFTTAPKFTSIPSTPTLLSPADSALNASVNMTFKWSLSQGTVTYRLQVSKSQAFDSLVLDDSAVADTTRTIRSLTDSTQYFWRVAAKNPLGLSAYSASRTFTTAPPPPLGPVLVSPADSSTDLSATLTLAWHPIPNATAYTIQVSTSQNFNSFAVNDSTDTDTTLQVGPLGNGTTYYWRVLGQTSPVKSQWSTRWRLATVAAIPATPVVLSSPADSAVGQASGVTLTWQRFAGATRYQIEISTVSDFSTVLIADSTTQARYSPANLQPESTYYWRVKAENSLGMGPFSDEWRFTMASTVSLRFGSIVGKESFIVLPGSSAHGGFDLVFSVPHKTKVLITAVNALGGRAEELVNATFEAGTYRTLAVTGARASGLYLLRMQADDFRMTKRVVLSRE